MRKLFLSIFGMIIFAAALCMSVSAEPAVSGGDSADPGHVHITEWQTNEEYHREVCTVCGETVSEGAHLFSEETGCYCPVCGRTEHKLIKLDHDVEAHFDFCVRCGQRFNEKPHTFYSHIVIDKFDNGHTEKCDTCDYVTPIMAHIPMLAPPEYDDDFHYFTCDHCMTKYSEPHILECYDYSDFYMGDVLGLSTKEAFGILRAKFGEDCIIMSEEFSTPELIYYYVKVPQSSNVCECSAEVKLDDSLYSYYGLNVENGIITALKPVMFTDGGVFHAGYIFNKDIAPKIMRDFPEEFSYITLLKYQRAGKAVINGKEYKIESGLLDESFLGYDGAVTYLCDFVSDSSRLRYKISNYTLDTIQETGETICSFIDPSYNSWTVDYLYFIPKEHEGAECTHNGGRYVYDEKEHYRVCELCGQSYGEGEHVFGADNKCACGYENHEHPVEWKSDNAYHYAVCTFCGLTVEQGHHQYESRDNCECEICGKIAHVRDRVGYDGSTHYDICYRCGEHYNIAPHNDSMQRRIKVVEGHDVCCDYCDQVLDHELHYCLSGEVQPGTTREYWQQHYSLCDGCGKMIYFEPHDYELIDYSDFDYSEILGMPEEEAIAALRGRFGEENVIHKEDLDIDDVTVYHVQLPLKKCTKCGAARNNFAYGDNVSGSEISIIDGKVARITYIPEQSWCSAVYHGNCPSYEKNLPEYMSLAELRKYAEAEEATFNGVKYGVCGFESDFSELTGIEGAKIYSFDFLGYDYVARYDVANFAFSTDFTTGESGYKLIDLSDESSTYISMIYTFKPAPAPIPGDVNGDSSVTLDDAIMTLKFAMNVDLGDAVFDPEAADVAGEAGISLEDAVMILKVAMGVEVLG